METYTLLPKKTKKTKNKLKNKNKTNRQTKTKTKKKKGKRYYVTFLDHLILLLLLYIRCNSQYTGYIYIVAYYKQQTNTNIS